MEKPDVVKALCRVHFKTAKNTHWEPMYWDIFNEDNLDLVIKTLPKTSMTKKVRIVSITKFQPKVFL